MPSKQSANTPCIWNVIKEFYDCLIVYSPQISFTLGTIFMTLSYEASSGRFMTLVHDWKVWVSIFLFLISFLLKKVLKRKSIGELENEIWQIANFYFQNAKEKALEEIRKKLHDEQEVDVTDYFHDLLAIIAQIHGFTAEERITVFSFDPEDDDQVILKIDSITEGAGEFIQSNKGV